jgi:K+-transporting ATPase ATPase C chain
MIFAIVMGLLFPLAMTPVAQAIFPYQANGSLVKVNGKIVGSALIAQAFTKTGYFWPRPSAAGNGYDPTSSGGTNLGPTSDKLINGVHPKLPNGKPDLNNPSNFDGVVDLAREYRAANNLSTDTPIPPDAVTRSASGLDPDISPANAMLQAGRVARQRGLSLEQVQGLVTQYAQGRQYGFFGEPRVNVLQINMALDDLAPGKAGK